MRLQASKLATGIALSAMLAGCVAPPPRTNYYQNQPPQNSGYYDRGNSGNTYGNSQRECYQCGRVTDVERVYAQDHSTSGGGAVIGAIVGGLLGSTVGKGDGRTAATVAGAVAGGFAGNAVERDSNGRSYNAYRFYVNLDDGRSAVVTQYDNPGFRPGDRVAISNNHLVLLR
ncbi:MAG: glycine zipper 2TM domain-containing protein [Rhodanobacteraceae bacterium]